LKGRIGVCARRLPIAEVIDRQLNANVVGVLAEECGARSVVRREDGFDPQALKSCGGDGVLGTKPSPTVTLETPDEPMRHQSLRPVTSANRF
jgi:hypothetical protein